MATTRYVKGRRNLEALGTDVIGALKWFFHIRRPTRCGPARGGAAAAAAVVNDEDELVSVHWEGSIKLFMKVPFDGDIMRPTYTVEGFSEKASAELGEEEEVEEAWRPFLMERAAGCRIYYALIEIVVRLFGFLFCRRCAVG